MALSLLMPGKQTNLHCQKPRYLMQCTLVLPVDLSRILLPHLLFHHGMNEGPMIAPEFTVPEGIPESEALRLVIVEPVAPLPVPVATAMPAKGNVRVTLPPGDDMVTVPLETIAAAEPAVPE